MRKVNRFEERLLRLLHAILRRTAAEQVQPILLGAMPAPVCLGRDAVELVQDALAKGTVAILGRAGGWRHERFLRGESPRSGRLWQRTPPNELGLSFSAHSLELLIRLTADSPDHPRFREQSAAETLGDGWLHFLIYDAFRQMPAGAALRQWPLMQMNALVRLLHFMDFMPAPVAAVDFTPWLASPAGVGILETLQPQLAAAWHAAELAKREFVNRDRLSEQSREQRAVLDSFLDSVERVGRRDLGRFFLEALRRTLPTDETASERWLRNIDRSGQRLSDRVELDRAALSTFQAVERLDAWNLWAQSVGYYDEDYEATQLWKVDWERLDGDAVTARARRVARQAEPLGSETA